MGLNAAIWSIYAGALAYHPTTRQWIWPCLSWLSRNFLTRQRTTYGLQTYAWVSIFSSTSSSLNELQKSCDSSARRSQSQGPLEPAAVKCGPERADYCDTSLQRPHSVRQYPSLAPTLHSPAGADENTPMVSCQKQFKWNRNSWTSYHGCWRLSVADANLTAGSCIASRSALLQLTGVYHRNHLFA